MKRLNNRLTKKEVLELKSKGLTQVEIAKMYNVTQSAISLMFKRLKYCKKCGEPIV